MSRLITYGNSYYKYPFLARTLGRGARINDPLVKSIVKSYLEELKTQNYPGPAIEEYTRLLRDCDRRRYMITDSALYDQQAMNGCLKIFQVTAFLSLVVSACNCIVLGWYIVLFPHWVGPTFILVSWHFFLGSSGACALGYVLPNFIFPDLDQRQRNVTMIEDAVMYSKDMNLHLQNVAKTYPSEKE